MIAVGPACVMSMIRSTATLLLSLLSVLGATFEVLLLSIQWMVVVKAEERSHDERPQRRILPNQGLSADENLLEAANVFTSPFEFALKTQL